VNIPRGIRNNNPGNVRRGRQHWLGEVDELNGVHDAEFVQCSAPVYGLRIPAVILLHYGAAGIKTPRAIVSRWAPPVENDTEAYIKAVTKALGCADDTKIDLRDPSKMNAVLKVLVQHENQTPGETWVDPYTHLQYQQAMVLAGIHLQ
jgi:hypothetical protein